MHTARKGEKRGEPKEKAIQVNIK